MTFRGFTTVTFFTDDMPAARAWYTRVFELEPYFVRDGAAQRSVRRRLHGSRIGSAGGQA